MEKWREQTYRVERVARNAGAVQKIVRLRDGPANTATGVRQGAVGEEICGGLCPGWSRL